MRVVAKNENFEKALSGDGGWCAAMAGLGLITRWAGDMGPSEG